MNTTDPSTGARSADGPGTDLPQPTPPTTPGSTAIAPTRPLLDRLVDVMLSTRIARPTDGRVLGGVCLGLARRYGIDPVLVRVGFAVLSLALGIGLTAYLALLLVLPNEKGEILLVQGLRHKDMGALGLIVLMLLTVFAPMAAGEDRTTWGRSIGILLLLGVIAWLILKDRPASVPVSGPDTAQGDHVGLHADVTGQTHREAAGGFVFDPATESWKAVPGAVGHPAADARPAPPTPKAPRTRPSGPRTFWPTVGIALAAFTITYLLMLAFGVTGATTIGWAVMIAALGLTLLVHGLRGTRNVTAAVLALVALISAPGIAASVNYWSNPGVVATQGRGTVSIHPATVAELNDRYEFGAGDFTLDLSAVPPEGFADFDGKHVTVDGGVGNVTLIVPPGANVEFHTEIGVGEVNTLGLSGDTGPAGGDGSDSGFGPTKTVRTGSGEPDLYVRTELGVGDVTIEER